MNSVIDRYQQMGLRLPVVYDWYCYDGEVKFVSWNYQATVKAGKPMMDICYCATKCMNGLVEKTVQFDKNRFSPAPAYMNTLNPLHNE